MLGLLLPLTFILICLNRLGARERDPLDQRPWQGDVLIAATIFGVIVLGITEGLSVFSKVNSVWLSVLCSLSLKADVMRRCQSYREVHDIKVINEIPTMFDK